MTDEERLVDLRPHIEAALKYAGGTHKFDDVIESIRQDKMQFWPGARSAVVTEIVVHPQMRSLHYFLAGGDLDELKLMRPMIEAWGKSVGCTRVTLAGRKGWERSFLKDEGYEPQWFVLAKEL